MDKRKATTVAVLITSVLIRAAMPGFTAGSPASEDRRTSSGGNPKAADRIGNAWNAGARLVDRAISILDEGWRGMTPDEQAMFLTYFDPGRSGEVDERFVRNVAENYRKIRDGFDREIAVDNATGAGECRGMRLFYTNFMKIFVCPFVDQETDPDRVARDLVHEMAHVTLLALDRAYYSASDSRYRSLTPYGHWTAELPIVGKLFREIARADTLYNPDSYSRFAMGLAGS